MVNICNLDGSIKEGGGQILRTAVSLGAILGTHIIVKNIRGGRANPGLRPQHLNGLMLMKNICQGELKGACVGSTQIVFSPQNINPGVYKADTKTAGSVGLIIQVAFPSLLYCKHDMGENKKLIASLDLIGGTDADMAPPIDFTRFVFLPFLEKYFLPNPPNTIFDINIELIKRGFFPKGGGHIKMNIYKNCSTLLEYLRPLNMLKQGQINLLQGHIYVTQCYQSMAQSIKGSVQELLSYHYKQTPCDIIVDNKECKMAIGQGAGVILIAITNTGCLLSGTASLNRNTTISELGHTAVENLLKNVRNGGCVDEYMQDQIIIFMALAKGRSQIRTGPVTLHTETVIYVVEQMIPEIKFSIEKCEDGTNIISCDGIGKPL